MSQLVSQCCGRSVETGTEAVKLYDEHYTVNVIVQYCDGCRRLIEDDDEMLTVCDGCGGDAVACQCEEGFQ